MFVEFKFKFNLKFLSLNPDVNIYTILAILNSEVKKIYYTSVYIYILIVYTYASSTLLLKFSQSHSITSNSKAA